MIENVKIGENQFEIVMPVVLEPTAVIRDWTNLLHEKTEDEWTVIPALPQYKFKNLKLKTGAVPEKVPGEITFNFTYDTYASID